MPPSEAISLKSFMDDFDIQDSILALGTMHVLSESKKKSKMANSQHYSGRKSLDSFDIFQLSWTYYILGNLNFRHFPFEKVKLM